MTITLAVPFELTISQIARANPTISNKKARKLAQELHDIIATVQKLYATNPPDQTELAARLPEEMKCLPYETAIAYELGDLIDEVRNTIFGRWPSDDSKETCNLSCWLMERLTDLDGSDALYVHYLRVCDRVQGTDFVDGLKRPRPRLVKTSASPPPA